MRFPHMNSDYHFCKLRIRFLLECKSVVGGLSNVQLPTKGAKGSKNGTYSLRAAAESRRRDHNHERIERSFSHFPIILSKNEFLLLPGTVCYFILLMLVDGKKGPPFYKCKLSRTLLQTTKIEERKGF